MANSLFEQFQSPSTMIQAEKELLELGERAVPILESLFSGEARNQFGIPYRQLGLPLRCAIEVTSRLGHLAKPLEPYLRAELRRGNHAAAMALQSFGSLDEATVSDLAASLYGDYDLAFEAALTLISCGAASRPAVLSALSESVQIVNLFAKVRAYYERHAIKSDA